MSLKRQKLTAKIAAYAALVFTFGLSALPALAATAIATCTPQPGYLIDCAYTGKDTGTTLYWQARLVTTGGDSGLTDTGLTATTEPDDTTTGLPLSIGGLYCNGADPSDYEDIGLFEADLTTLVAGTRYNCFDGSQSPYGGGGGGGGGGGIDFAPATAGIGSGVSEALTFVIWLMLGVLGAAMVAAGVLRGFRAIARHFGLNNAKVPIADGLEGRRALEAKWAGYGKAPTTDSPAQRAKALHKAQNRRYRLNSGQQRQHESAFRAGHGGMSRRQWRKFKRQHPHPSGRKRGLSM